MHKSRIALRCSVLVPGLLFYASAASQAWSQALPEQEMEQASIFSLDNWNVNVGGGVGIGPTYPGSDDYKIRTITMGSVSYRNTLFLGPAGLAANFLKIKGLRGGPVLGYRGGRKQAADRHLNGLGNVGASIEGGIFLGYQFGPFEISGTYRHALTSGNNGAISRIRLDYQRNMLNNQLEVHLGPEIDFGDGRYVGKWFGVTPAQSTASHLPVFNPEGGVTGAGFYVTADYKLTPHFFVHAFGDVRQLAGDAANSPIVLDQTQAITGFGLVYHWQDD